MIYILIFHVVAVALYGAYRYVRTHTIRETGKMAVLLINLAILFFLGSNAIAGQLSIPMVFGLGSIVIFLNLIWLSRPMVNKYPVKHPRNTRRKGRHR